MARPLRIELPGAVYHVTSRGNERRPIVRDDQDREKFVELLGQVVFKFGLRLYEWVLLDNTTTSSAARQSPTCRVRCTG